MAINNYELANKPYTRGFGDNIKTVVEIRLSEGNRYSTNMRELTGDRTSDPEDVLIQDVLDILKAELDPGSAIVKAQAQLEQANQKIAQNESEQNKLAALANKIDKVVRVMAQDSIMGEKVSYGTTYKEMVELFPLAEVGKVYEPGAIFTVEDPAHVEVDGEGKRILVQLNKEFTYNGEPVSDFARDGRLEMNGTGVAWKYVPQGQNEPTNVAPAAAVSTTATVTSTVTEPSATTVASN